jgi:IS30 family transposase
MSSAKRLKPQGLNKDLMLFIMVASKLNQDWSPRQISR